jgi:hypothetical protein
VRRCEDAPMRLRDVKDAAAVALWTFLGAVFVLMLTQFALFLVRGITGYGIDLWHYIGPSHIVAFALGVAGGSVAEAVLRRRRQQTHC